MKIFKIFSMAALTMIMAACSNEETIETTPAVKSGIPFTAVININGDATRTTMAEGTGSDAGKIFVEWKGDGTEKVALIHNGVRDVVTVSSVSSGTATITGSLTGEIATGDAVKVVYPASYAATATGGTSYTGDASIFAEQGGTLDYIGKNLDVREATGELMLSSGSATLNGNVTLASQVAIWKVSPQNGGSAINTKKLTVKDAAGNLLAETSDDMTATNDVYIALLPVSNKEIYLEAYNGDDFFDFSKTGVTLAGNTYYQSTVTMVNEAETPLTLKAKSSGWITVKSGGSYKPTMYYKINGGATQTVSYGNDINVNNGDEISFYCYSSTLATSFTNHVYFDLVANCSVYGNIMSLIDDSSAGFAADKEISGDYAFEGLFVNNYTLYNHPTKRLLMPATTLTQYCYDQMFKSFSGSYLKTAPVLPATTLAIGCYRSMFEGCVSMTTAPEIKASTLVDASCAYLFKGCSSLNYIKFLATDIGENCTLEWLDGIPATGTFVKAPTATWAVAGTNGIPSGWTVK